jgi:hypothetical protein
MVIPARAEDVALLFIGRRQRNAYGATDPVASQFIMRFGLELKRQSALDERPAKSE